MKPRDERRYRFRCDLLARAIATPHNYPDGIIAFSALLVAECDAGGWWRLAWRVFRIAFWHEVEKIKARPWRARRATDEPEEPEEQEVKT